MTKPYDLLAVAAAFGETRQMSLRDPKFREAFASHVEASLDEALDDPLLLHGQRTQAMFEALVFALGEVMLIKQEDGGRLFPSDRFRLPDNRIVLQGGEQWLVEVKNVYRHDPTIQRSNRLLRRPYLEAQQAYAAATGAKLKLAVYWARWSIWTLVSPEDFTDVNGDVSIDLHEAMRANELAELGDRTLGTRAPLRFRMVMDGEKTSPIAANGDVLITIGKAQLMAGERVIEDEIEREIASVLMEYGDWTCDGPLAQIEGDRLLSIDFVWEPEHATPGQGFDMVGTLSRMFARYYARKTLREGEVRQLRAPMRPGWFAPLTSGEMPQRVLPLWRFALKPVAPLRKAA
ncbi:hypothetical protein H8M03_02945 [Sphingomonas sabuli]|uniref:Uncharacterized protein n=1 Tax=Sphingomonas sabuli TaxID=2764186 RepID=A0A7G9L3X0_9SPHN|nr:hypothetical protein [Sphingomonas sabuli]QNM83319.1 hypothetical protein H8M03_02945 [Sphingomonas sabuli]